MASLPPQLTYPMCTIRETPRLPEHCIQYAYVIEWETHFGKAKAVDKDSPEDMMWICERAQERAAAHGIEGVDYNKTMGVVKNIIPAIASTNAIVSAACVTEVLKIMTNCNFVLDNYMQYMGQTGVNTHTYVSERLPDCMVCSLRQEETEAKRSDKLGQVLERITTAFDLSKPGFNLPTGDILYIPAPPQLEGLHHYKLDLTIQELIDKAVLDNGDQLWTIVRGKAIKAKMTVKVKLT